MLGDGLGEFGDLIQFVDLIEVLQWCHFSYYRCYGTILSGTELQVTLHKCTHAKEMVTDWAKTRLYVLKQAITSIKKFLNEIMQVGSVKKVLKQED